LKGFSFRRSNTIDLKAIVGGEASSPRHSLLYKLSMNFFFSLAIACCYVVALLFTSSKKHLFFSLHFVGVGGALVARLGGIIFHYNYKDRQEK
jgi:hypothetical protein